MPKSKAILGAILVLTGAASYGVLATIVKLSYNQGYTPAEVTLAQFGIGMISIAILYYVFGFRQRAKHKTIQKKPFLKLLLAGIPLGLTSVVYYLAVQYIPVSVGTVLLMQSVWMGVVLEAILDKKVPSAAKIVASGFVIIGTLLATNVYYDWQTLDTTGIIWGLLSAVTYTCTIFASNRVVPEFGPLRRSFYMMLGGSMVVMLSFGPSLITGFNLDVLWPWGVLLAIFGTILPPILFNVGMPLTGIGFGTILSSIEIPVSVFMAYQLLSEPVNALQWFGIVLIILAITLMNLRSKNKTSREYEVNKEL